MAFEDVARRMSERRRPTRAERLKEFWHGEPAELPPLPTPVAPAGRTKLVVAAYLVLFLGLLIAVVATATLILSYTSTSPWQHRGLELIIAIGVGLVIKSTRMFDVVEVSAPLPDARLQRRG